MRKRMILLAVCLFCFLPTEVPADPTFYGEWMVSGAAAIDGYEIIGLDLDMEFGREYLALHGELILRNVQERNVFGIPVSGAGAFISSNMISLRIEDGAQSHSLFLSTRDLDGDMMTFDSDGVKIDEATATLRVLR